VSLNTAPADTSGAGPYTGIAAVDPPAAAPPPAPTGLADAAILDGYVNQAHDTASQALTGTAVAGATIAVYDGATQLGATTADASGAWSFTLGKLADGAHALTATASNADGVSAASAALQFTVDTQPPVPAVANLACSSGTHVATLSGTSEAGSTIQIYEDGRLLGSATANASGAWTYAARLGFGVHSFTETATDPAGNTGASSGQALVSRAGSAAVTGGSGDDLLVGAPGDTLTGGGGDDRFVFHTGFGRETVTDFDTSQDVIALDHTLFSSFSSVMQHAAQSGSSVLITYDRADVITLQNTTLSSLGAGDFVFL
jgi:hypothetical protein